MKNLATPSSIFNFFLIHRRALLSANQRQCSSNRANVPRKCWAKLFGPLQLRHSSTNTLNYICEAKVRPVKNRLFTEYSQLCSWRNVRPIKNGFNSDLIFNMMKEVTLRKEKKTVPVFPRCFDCFHMAGKGRPHASVISSTDSGSYGEIWKTTSCSLLPGS